MASNASKHHLHQSSQPSCSGTGSNLKPTPMKPTRIPVTDLDHSDNGNKPETDKPKKPHRHRKVDIKKYSGNFPTSNSRSRSADHRNFPQKDTSDIAELKILLQTKADQIEKLIQKITELHTYNEEFAQDNDRLQSEMQEMSRKFENLTSTFEKEQKKTCDACMKWSEEKENIFQSNKTLKNDVEMMKTLVFRLNVQVERYQDKIRKISAELPSSEENEHLQPPPSQRLHTESPLLGESLHWGTVNAHTLSPLLNSYEEMIREKDDLIQQHEHEMNRFTGQMKEILVENDRLHKEMDEIRKGKDGWREERTRLQAQLDICRSKAELQTRRGDLAKEKLVEVLRCYEQKVQSQALDLERLQEAYGRAKGELVSYKHLNQQPEVIIESLKECQRLFEELKAQHTNDRQKISNELDSTKKSNLELETKNSNLKDEISNFKSEIAKLVSSIDELKEKNTNIKKASQKLKESRDRLKARLRIALQWAQKLDESREKMKSTWDELKELQAIVRHKEGQIRGLHARHLEEVGKLEKKLTQRDETIKSILKERAKTNN